MSARSFSRARLALLRNDTSISAYVTPKESLIFDDVVMTCFLLAELLYYPVLIASDMSAKA